MESHEKVIESKHNVMDSVVISLKMWDRKSAFVFLLEQHCDSKSC